MKNLILVAIVFIQGVSVANAITVLQAIQQKKAKVIITGKPDNDPAFSNSSSYYGKCLKMVITNTSNVGSEYSLPAGSFIYPEDSSVQRMIVVNSEMISLAPGKTKTMGIYAMCSQMHDGAPSCNDVLAMGNLSSGNVLALAQLIDKQNYTSSAAQNAIWAITDDNEIASIYSEDKTEMNVLRNFVCKALNKPLPKDELEISKYSNTGSVHSVQKKSYAGVLHFKTAEKQDISMTVYDSTGKVLLDFFKNQPCGRSNNVNIDYTFEYYDYPKGTYYVKIIGIRKEILASQAIHLK